jgi:predicted AAA+ superfamily ATPase
LPRHETSVRKQLRNPRKLHVVDPGLVSAFKAGAEGDRGHKLETAVYLECRHREREWHYQTGDVELDLCNADGTAFINVCWDLSDATTAAREAAAMAAARAAYPRATGTLLYHEFAPRVLASLPDAQPAWQWLAGQTRRARSRATPLARARARKI